MRKKLLAGMLAAALVFTVGTISAFAAESYYCGCPGHYVSGVWVHCADADNDGSCDACGAAVRMGAGFIDEDGDGICDHYASGACGNGCGCGAGRQGGRRGGAGLRGPGRSGHIAADGAWVRCADADGDGVCDTCDAAIRVGPGFVDEDGDGVCDNAASGARRGGTGGGAGRQRGCHGGRGR